MAYVAAMGHALLMPSGTGHDPGRKHLFIVVTDACAEGKHLLASITSWTNDLCDGTTRLDPGCHPFVYKDSYILYRKAVIEAAAVLSTGVDAGIFTQHKTPIDAAIIARIMTGICQSIFTPRKVKRYANCP